MDSVVKRLVIKGASLTNFDDKGMTPFMMLFQVYGKDI